MIYFISDLHLGLGEPSADKAREDRLLQFLSSAKPHCERLFILGDLFDYWFEFGTVVQKQHIRTLAALGDYVSSGIRVDYLIGNHDFGHKTYFERELGVHIHKNDLELTLHGKQFYLAHGDGKALHEPLYPFIRGLLRNPLAQWAWTQLLHPDIGVGLAAYFSRKSRISAEAQTAKQAAKQERKSRNEEAGLEAFAEARIQAGCEVIVMGHTHKPKTLHFDYQSAAGKVLSGLYVNTGDWLTHDTFAEFDGKTVSLRRLEDVLQ